MVVEGLTLDLSGTYNAAEINDPTPTAQASGITPGTRVLSVPLYTAVAGLNYKKALTDTLNGVFNVSSSLVGPVRD